jgi:predicted transglutaminase-like cysteine proteinase
MATVHLCMNKASFRLSKTLDFLSHVTIPADFVALCRDKPETCPSRRLSAVNVVKLQHNFSYANL